jgi:hypothetical protein
MESLFVCYYMTRIARLSLRADSTGTLELVCERSAAEEAPEVRSFAAKDEFGIIADGLEPDERVTLFFEGDTDEPAGPE